MSAVMTSEAAASDRKYEDPRAHAVRARYLATFGGPELPVPVEAIAEDLLGLRVEEAWDLDCSGMLLPAERRIVLNADELVGPDEKPILRYRFTIAHEIGHWVCHCLEGRAPNPEPSYCRPIDLTDAADRTLEREANVFAAELLMPEPAVREAFRPWLASEDPNLRQQAFFAAPDIAELLRGIEKMPFAMRVRCAYEVALRDSRPLAELLSRAPVSDDPRNLFERLPYLFGMLANAR